MTLRFALLAAAAAALLMGGRAATAEVVNPWRTTLPDLVAAADAVVRARVVEATARERRLAIDEVVWCRAGVLAPAAALAPACVPAGGPDASALAFLVRGNDGGFRLIGAERGWIAGDPEAEAFVRAALERGPDGPDEGGEARLAALVGALESRSARVRDDALREVAKALAGEPRLEAGALAAILAAARVGLGAADPEPAILALARLPARAGEPALVDAVRRKVAPALVGRALRGRTGAVRALLADLERTSATDAAWAGNILRALGHAGDPLATGAAVRALDDAATRRAALEALIALRDRAAVPALKRQLATADREWAAVALACAGGDEALGALEFALHNHEDEALRRFIARLLADPAEARALLEIGSP